MGINEIRALKAAKTGTVMTAEEAKNLFKNNAAKVIYKKCEECGKLFEKLSRYSMTRWGKIRFCSVRCAQEKNKIKDGTTRGQRDGRKKGCLPKGSPEYFERMSKSTKEGMANPEVQEKLRRPKGPMSEAQKANISNKLVGKVPSNINSIYNGPYGNVKRGEYECSKGSVYFRSKWEANYALYLDFLISQAKILKWEFEADVFFFDQTKFGTRSYRPDFKVFNIDGTIEYHEIKGHMNSSSKTKLKRMKKYHPEIKVVLIEKKRYEAILSSMKGLIKFYK